MLFVREVTFRSTNLRRDNLLGIELVLMLAVVFMHPDNTNIAGADTSLARPGRKQATATEDFEFHISYL